MISQDRMAELAAYVAAIERDVWGIIAEIEDDPDYNPEHEFIPHLYDATLALTRVGHALLVAAGFQP